jgi:hypothetical protein
MNEPLRPMNLGEILDRTFQIYRAKFLVFAGIAALPALALLAIHLADFSLLHIHTPASFPKRGGVLMWSLLIALGFNHLSGFLSLLIYPAFAKLASNVTLGETGTILSSLRFASARWRSYLWVAILKLSVQLLVPELLIALLFIGAAFLASAAGQLDSPGMSLYTYLFALPLIAGGILFLWFSAFLSLAVPVCALEQIAGTRALRRSWVLTKGSRIRIMVAWLMIVTTSMLLVAGLRLLLRSVVWICFGHHFELTSPLLYVDAFYLLGAAISTLIGPIYPIALTLFYYDQRIRLEGYDIERMMEEAGMTAPVTLPGADGLTASGSEEAQA